MASSMTKKCPSCGAYLEYQPGKAVMRCPYCGSEVRLEDTASAQPASAQTAAQQDSPVATQTATDETNSYRGFSGYHCQNCGAEVVTGPTTAATRCYFCHSPVTLTDRLSGSFRPNKVVPFALTQDAAKGVFQQWIKSKHFVDERFLSEDQLSLFSGVYYPYWLGEVQGTASFTGKGTTVSTNTVGNNIITTTSHYDVQRETSNRFTGLVRKALKRVDSRMSDGIQPYRMNEAKPYDPGYLSGFMAETRDVPMEDARADMLRDCTARAEEAIQEKRGMNTLKGSAHFTASKVSLDYALMPAWVLTYKSQQRKPYYFMMNGQTGQIFGRLPVKRGKLLLVSALLGGLVAGLLCAGGAFIW